MAKWEIEGTKWIGTPEQAPEDWDSSDDFVFEVDAETSVGALAEAARLLALKPSEELHTIQCVQLHFGRKRKA